MVYQTEFIGIYALLLTTGLFFIFSVRQYVFKRAYSSRIEQDGGSVFFGKYMMEFGYWVLNPITRFCVYARISPNLISLLCLFSGILSGGLFALGYFAEAGASAILSGLFDALDGRVARALGKTKKSGALMDSTIDRICEMMMSFGLIYYYRDDPAALILCFAMLMGAILTSYATAKGDALQVKDMPRGVMRRGERALYLSLAALFSPLAVLFFEPTVEKPRFLLMLGVLGLVAIGTLYSSLVRNIWLYKYLDKNT